jgi:4-methyl-5(b-hydroxyethyl)-thiazole monophosphate biosynthesis
MKGLLIVADGFQDTEALSTRDVLRRSRIMVDIATINPNLEVTAQTGLVIKANLFLKDAKADDYDFVVIPGGKTGVDNLNRDSLPEKIIAEFAKKKKLIAAICAGPTVVKNYPKVKFTCYPGMEGGVIGGIYVSDRPVVTDSHFITARTLAYSIDFALAIIEYLQGRDQRNAVYKNIHGEL